MRAGKEGPPRTKTLNSDLLPTPAPPPLGRRELRFQSPLETQGTNPTLDQRVLPAGPHRTQLGTLR